jgi:molybdate transport system ATP-binding protein
MKLELSVKVTRPGGFSLDVAVACEAEALAIVGPSGAGKSTLLDAIAGVERGARVVIDGEDVSRRPLHERGLGYVTQDALLFPHLSVRANLLFSPRAISLGDVPEALGISGLLDRMPRNLSGGERRRAALARAILGRPRLLLLDEPFAGLDESTRREAMSLLDRVRRRFGVPIVLVSHAADEVIALTDRAVRLDGGRVVASGASAAVLRAGETRIDNFFVATVVGPRRVRAGGAELAVVLPEGASGDVRLACYATDVILAAEMPSRLSARNCVRTTVAAMERAAGGALVTLAAPPLRVLVTEEAALALELAPGRETVAIVKATSIDFLGAA